MLELLVWVLIGYLSGSVLYSKLIATYILKVDLRAVGDGNPGTFNVGKAGGARWAVIAFILDMLKAAIPVGIAHFAFGINDWRLPLLAIAPAIGHRYPLFFGFQGGKAIAAVAGGWVGIATWEVITVGGLLLLVWYLTVEESAWATLLMVLTVGAYVLLRGANPIWLGYWVLMTAFLIWTHYPEIKGVPTLKGWARRLLWRQS
jgi:glycerol-3-phosphate acyltransferase PlsY